MIPKKAFPDENWFYLNSPADFNITGEDILQFEWQAEGNFFLGQIFKPLFIKHVYTIFPAECPNIAEETCSKQAVP